jgi:hypothetical protein
MKRSSGSPRNPSKLSDSIHRQLNKYALAASAAGVGMLALVQPAGAKIVYTRTHQVIRPKDSYALDLNHDGVTDFRIKNSSGCADWCWDNLGAIAVNQNAVVGIISVNGTDHIAYALNRGADISRKQPFLSGGALFVYDSGSGNYGDWLNVTNRYLGLRFQIKGKIHYGWARLTVHGKNQKLTAILTGYAYETIPNKPIIAGQTKGPDVIAIQPASLGRLAAGSAAWHSGE